MSAECEATPKKKAGNARSLVLVAVGIVVGQGVLYGPALTGSKILLPLGVLAENTKYIPHSPGQPEIESPKPVLLDLLTITEPDRRFAAKELSAGRFPLWTPHEFGGVPFTWPKYSPYFLLTALSESPFFIAWVQVLAALVAGFGAFAFCSRVLKLSDWPSILAAWCYPLTGWFILWQGFAAAMPVTWLPWILYAVERTVRGIRGAGIGLAVVTALALVSGNPDVAGQVLLVAGLFALWCVWDVHRRGCIRFWGRKGGLTLAMGFGLGILLAAPNLLPFHEYSKTSIRLARRGHGVEERPPFGLAALPQIVLPDMYGTFAEKGTCPLLEANQINQLESPAQIYTGLLVTFLLAPWAFRDRKRRSASVFFVALAGIGLAWTLNLPGFVQVLRLPFLNLMSHNRLVFASSFALLALAAIGLESMLFDTHRRPWRWWWWQLPLLAGFLGWCIYRSQVFPEPLATGFEKRIHDGNPDIWVPSLEALREAQAWFSHRYLKAAVLCAAGIALWLTLKFRPSTKRFAFPVVGLLMVVDLLLFGYGKRVTQDVSLYFPEVPALREVANATPGREIAIDCLPANLAQAVGLMDIRGFDSVDPERWLKLLWIASGTEGRHTDYAATQSFVPRWRGVPPDEIRFPAVLDMVSVRYAIFRGVPGPAVRPRFRSEDYWVLENRHALPRVYIPNRVESVPSDDDVLRKLALPDFDAREVAYVNSNVAMWGTIRGEAKIKEETPTRIVVDAQMQTRGLLVLADNWDKGWRAYVNGKRTPILRTNYTIRGVLLPTGSSTVEFRYESPALALGNLLAVAAMSILLGWGTALRWRRRRPAQAAGRTLSEARGALAGMGTQTS
jgi:hypothetical protein